MHLGTHTPRRTLTWPLSIFALALASTVTLGAGCKDPVLLLTVTAEARVDTFDITVTTADRHRDVLLQKLGEPVDSDDPTRDISQSGSELRLALEFQETGHYFIHLVGYSSGPPQVFTHVVHVKDRGENRKDIFLIQIAGMDGDGDGFISQAACDQLQSDSISCDYADCEDASPLVNPLAQEICGDGIDNDCIGGDALCVDADGDGYFVPDDCDDTDPAINPGALEPPNDCNGGPAGLCNDGIDQDCDGQDTVCLADSDCDGSSDAQDCEPNNPDIFPGQSENCTNTIDDNCNGLINEGCVPCDLDGDDFQRDDPDNGCIIGAGELPDCDDFDSGVNPNITAGCGGNEGGSLACVAMQLCDGIDNDCDGLVDEGCLDPVCDADGDSYQNAGPTCNPPVGQ